jgi:hypothetical protein
LTPDEYPDAVIQIETNQNSEEANNYYGLTCRNDPNVMRGYYFLIAGDGYYTITKKTEAEGSWEPLVDWAESSVINQGQDSNQITAVCTGDYLALYVNGELLAEANDADFTDGFTGITVGAYEDKSLTDVSFDNLVIWGAAVEGGSVPPNTSSGKPNKPVTGDIADILAAGEQSVTVGDLLMDEEFNSDENWPEFDDGDGFTGVFDDNAYRVAIEGNFYSWQSSDDSYENLVIQVDTTLNSKVLDNNFGVMCRASGRNGIGYYLLISGDGYYTIMKLINPDDGREQLVEWTESDAINQGVDATNQITAVCVDDYLALYANGQLLAETRDEEFSQGRMALTVGSFDENATTDVSFDNLKIWDASASK